MDFKFVLFSIACFYYYVTPAVSTSLVVAAAAAKGAGLAGLAHSGSGKTVVVQAEPGAVLEAQGQVIIQQPAYKPVHPVTLIPIATISSNSFADKLSNLWSGIADSISSKSRAVCDFFRSFRGPPKIVLIAVNTTTTTTSTTTKKPQMTKKPKTTTHPPLVLEIISVPEHQRVYQVPMPVLEVEDYDKK